MKTPDFGLGKCVEIAPEADYIIHDVKEAYTQKLCKTTRATGRVGSSHRRVFFLDGSASSLSAGLLSPSDTCTALRRPSLSTRLTHLSIFSDATWVPSLTAGSTVAGYDAITFNKGTPSSSHSVWILAFDPNNSERASFKALRLLTPAGCNSRSSALLHHPVSSIQSHTVSS